MAGPELASSPPRPMDRALQALAKGDPKAALRELLPAVESDPTALGVAITVLAAEGLVPSPELAKSLGPAVTNAIETNNLPVAVVCASLLRKLGSDPASAYDAIAVAFGRGSARLRERRGAAPPELPKAAVLTAPVPANLSDGDLGKRVRAALDAAGATLQRGVKGAPLSPAPLFSALTPDVLKDFIAIFEIKVSGEAERVVAEGELGMEAFVLARGELDVTRAGAGGAGQIHLARLGIGALVGEMALLSRAPRAASVVAVRPSVLLAASKQALDRAAQATPRVGREFAEQCRRRMLDNLARTCVLFRSVTSAERPVLVDRFTIRAFEPGERIITQGTVCEGLHIVASGGARVVKQEKTEKTIVAQLGPGEILGEVALVLRRPAIAEVVAHHPTLTLFLPRDRFLELVRAHPKMFVDLYELAVRRDEETSGLDALETIQTDESVLV